jgi:hypothetical protein
MAQPEAANTIVKRRTQAAPKASNTKDNGQSGGRLKKKRCVQHEVTSGGRHDGCDDRSTGCPRCAGRHRPHTCSKKRSRSTSGSKAAPSLPVPDSAKDNGQGGNRPEDCLPMPHNQDQQGRSGDSESGMYEQSSDNSDSGGSASDGSACLWQGKALLKQIMESGAFVPEWSDDEDYGPAQYV